MSAAAAQRTMPSVAPVIDIVSAMDHPGLFGAWFPGTSWDHWRVVLKAAFALPMTEAECEFFRTVAERDPPTKQVKQLWCIIGRGGGKDSVASLIAAYAAALFEHRRALRPGESAIVQCLACDRDQAKIVMGYTRSYFTGIPPLRAMVKRETAYGFELNNGVDVTIATNSYRAVRGRTVLCAILDECAFFRDERSSSPDEETYRAITPGLARMPGSMLIGISTPYRKAGLLYRMFAEHYGRDGDDVLVIRAPSTTFNPTLDGTIIDAALAEDPAGASAEWLAQFRDDISGWATRELIEGAVDRGVMVRAPLPGVRYHSFVDASGGVSDSYTCGVAHNENGTVVLDCLVEVRAPFNADAATAQIAGVLKSYRCSSTTGDKYAAGWVVQAFQKNGIRYQHSERDRSALYLDALPLFSSGRVRLLDSQRLVSQFASLERIVSPSGKDKIQHPRGGHDDCCNSVAGAIVLAQAKVSWFSAERVRREMAVLRRMSMVRAQRAAMGGRFY
jgi:hypothetical protein